MQRYSAARSPVGDGVTEPRIGLENGILNLLFAGFAREDLTRKRRLVSLKGTSNLRQTNGKFSVERQR